MITAIRFVVGALVLPFSISAQDRTSYVIDNVNVVDVAAGRVIPQQRVVITGSRIVGVGAANAVPTPPGANIVNAAGKYLIPGLWDMHVHVAPGAMAGQMLGLFLANGVTGVRDMGTGVEALVTLRSAVSTGQVLGPRIVGAGVLVDGEPIVYPGITLRATTPDGVRKVVDSLAGRGVNFIKAYEMLRPEVYLALAEQARARGLPYAGHLPLMVSAEDAVRAGHRSFEHLRNLEVSCSSKADSLRAVARQMIEAGNGQPGMRLRGSIHATLRPRAYDTYDDAKCRALVAQMAQAGVWQTPNLVLATQNVFRHDTTDFMRRWLPYLPAPMRESFQRAGEPGRGSQRPSTASRGTEWMMRLAKMLHDAGVRVLPGSDFPNPVMMPGPSLHEELALLVRAGLTPAEALRAGTLNPAIYLGATDSLGTISPGKLADVVLLDADPLQDIRHVARVHAIWRGGRYLSRSALDVMLEGFAKATR
ncbi:MAG TPA: amidohydrolase family protein [Gemmatimonadaceae bacterium]